MARRRSYYNDFYYQPTRPIETQEGIKARSQRGAFAKNWWAKKWIDALERLVDPGRLSRGRNYARRGQVLSIEELAGGVEARVQGSRKRPYNVSIRVAPLTAAQWEQVMGALSEQALFTAQLLTGEMPLEVEDAFGSVGVSLFPAQGGDLITTCSCPDWANPCKHVAATHYILGERFDEDPFLLFRLRGQTQEQIIQGLRARRTDQEGEESEVEQETTTLLEERLDRFWELGAPGEGFSMAIKPPDIEMPILKRLGEPSFIRTPGLLTLLTPVYEAITRSALTMAYREAEREEGGK
jgi:uncharacterized Zn finger protein